MRRALLLLAITACGPLEVGETSQALKKAPPALDAGPLPAFYVTDCAGCAPKTSFSAFDTYDIFFVGAVAPDHIEAFMPNGYAYQTWNRAPYSMPVAGTLIEYAQLYGTWQAKHFVGGTLRETISFQVTP